MWTKDRPQNGLQPGEKMTNWYSEHTPAKPRNVLVPTEGEFFVRNGVVMPILESEFQDYVEDAVSYTIWVMRDSDE